MDLFAVTLASFVIAAIASAVAWRASGRARTLAAQVVETERATKAELSRQSRAFADRAIEMERRQHELRAVLAHVNEGYLVVDANGVIGPERSRIMTTWFGELPHMSTFEAFVARHDPEAAAERMPQRIRSGARTYDLAYRPIAGGCTLVVISNARTHGALRLVA